MDETTITPEDATPGTPANEPTPPGPGEAGPPAGPALPDDFPALPPQYSTAGDAGFFNRQNESVPTAVTLGPDGAIYTSELSALPYPDGYARVLRVAEGEGGVPFDGETQAGVSQIHASGLDQLNGLTFDDEGNLYALEYVNGAAIYDPTLDPAELPPSRIVKVGTDGSREVVSGDELLLANYVLHHEGVLYATINDADTEDGKLLAYTQDDAGEWSVEELAEGLHNPRGLDVGPDGKLYILEQGLGTPLESPEAADAPVIPFIPGLVSQSGGYTGAISALDTETGEVERVYEGLPSFREFNPSTNESRVISIGPNGFGIAEDGTVFVASGGGLSNQSVAALGPFAEGVSGILRLEGLFDEDPSDAEWELAFNSVEYAGANGPDGATTLFNTQSNLNDVEVGPDGAVYTVDAARNVLYELDADGEDVQSVTVLQKTGPVLTPVQYALVIAAGGEPAADYRVEVTDLTFKGSNELPDTPGRAAALAAGDGPGAPGGGFDGGGLVPGVPDGTNTPPRGEDAIVAEGLADGGGELEPNEAIVPPNGAQPTDGTEDVVPVDNPGAPPAEVVDVFPGAGGPVDPGPDAPTTTPDGAPTASPDGEPGGPPALPGDGPPDGFDPTDFDPSNPPPDFGEPTPLIPGPVDPIAPSLTPGNPYEATFDPFFGVYAPAEGDEPLVGGQSVDQLFVFGDRATEDGGAFGKAAVAEAAGFGLPIDQAPYGPYGTFTDGLNWTTHLARILGVEDGPTAEDPNGGADEGPDTNFSYLDATARELENPFDPLQEAAGGLTDFTGQIDAFEEAYGTFSPDDLVVVSFGGNDLTLPPGEGQSPEEAAAASIQATIDGIARLASLGAEKLLVANLVDVEIVPIFSDPEFAAQFGPPGALTEAVTAYNAALEGVLGTIEENTDLDVTLLDLNGLFENIVAEPGAYGFVNTGEPVLVTPPNPDVPEPVYNPAIVGQDPAVQHATLFLDVLFSPTSLAQSIMAETARDALLSEPGGDLNLVLGTEGSERLEGTDGDDLIDGRGGRFDRLTGEEGADVFVFAAPDGDRDRAVIRDYEVGVDVIRLDGAVVDGVRETDRGVLIRLEGDADKIHVRGDDVSADTIDIQGDGLLV